jgi:hypothetical protein
MLTSAAIYFGCSDIVIVLWCCRHGPNQQASWFVAGMDPISRKAVSDIIQEAKQGRALVLTTHSMEEADVLLPVPSSPHTLCEAASS